MNSPYIKTNEKTIPRGFTLLYRKDESVVPWMFKGLLGREIRCSYIDEKSSGDIRGVLMADVRGVLMNVSPSGDRLRFYELDEEGKFVMITNPDGFVVNADREVAIKDLLLVELIR